jgi:hypothetical protein
VVLLLPVLLLLAFSLTLFSRQAYFTRRIGSKTFSQTMPALATNKTGSMLIAFSFDPFDR